MPTPPLIVQPEKFVDAMNTFFTSQPWKVSVSVDRENSTFGGPPWLKGKISSLEEEVSLHDPLDLRALPPKIYNQKLILPPATRLYPNPGSACAFWEIDELRFEMACTSIDALLKPMSFDCKPPSLEDLKSMPVKGLANLASPQKTLAGLPFTFIVSMVTPSNVYRSATAPIELSRILRKPGEIDNLWKLISTPETWYHRDSQL